MIMNLFSSSQPITTLFYCIKPRIPQVIVFALSHMLSRIGDPSRFYGSRAHPGCGRALRFPNEGKDDLLHLILTDRWSSLPRNFTSDANHPACPPSVCYLRDPTERVSYRNDNGMHHWFKNWDHLRNSKLTASTFGGAVGLWRGRRVQLWLEKLGLIEPFRGNVATCWSNIQEVVALERYKLITGNSISYPEFRIYNTEDPYCNWLGASADGVVEPNYYSLHDGGVLEIKCPFFKGEVEKELPWLRVPPYYMPQAQGLMEILNRDWMDFYVWTPNGSSLFRIERNMKYWELLKFALEDFWWGHVFPAREQLCSENVAVTNLMLLKPAPRHALCSDILRYSNHLADNATRLVREVGGKLLT